MNLDSQSPLQIRVSTMYDPGSRFKLDTIKERIYPK